MSEFQSRYFEPKPFLPSDEFADAYDEHVVEEDAKKKKLTELEAKAAKKLEKFKEGLKPGKSWPGKDEVAAGRAREIDRRKSRSIENLLQKEVLAEEVRAKNFDQAQTTAQKAGLDTFLKERKWKKVRGGRPSKAALEARQARVVDMGRRNDAAAAQRSAREESAAKVRADRLAYAQASAKAREATGHNEFALYEISEQPEDSVDDLKEPTNQNIVRQEEVIKVSPQREKGSLGWMMAVNVFLDEGSVGLKRYLLSSQREGEALTVGQLRVDAELQRALKEMFPKKSKDELGFTDFLHALPTEQEYIDQEMANIAAANNDEEELSEDDLIPYRILKSPTGKSLGELDGEDNLLIENKFDMSDVSGAEVEPLNPFAEIQNDKANGKELVRNSFLETPSVPRLVNKNVVRRVSVRSKPSVGTEKSQLQNVASMPSKSFVPEGVLAELEQISRDFNRNKNQQPVVGEIYNSDKFSLDVEKDLLKHAQDEYVQAYRTYYGRETAQMLDSQVLAAKPPMFAFRSAAKNLKRLYAEMMRVKEEISEYEEKQNITESLRKHVLVKPKPDLQPTWMAAAEESNKREEKTVSVKQQRINTEVDKLLDSSTMSDGSIMSVNKFFDRQPNKPGETVAYFQKVKEKSGMNPNFSSPLTRELKNKTVQEGIDTVVEARAEGIKKKLQEIEGYFADKKIDAGKTIRQYLLGEEIRGWFKGEQKRLQQEYKDLYNNPVYQKYLKK